MLKRKVEEKIMLIMEKKEVNSSQHSLVLAY